MIDNDLLNILACPETKKDLVLADADLVARINERITTGKVLTKMKVAVKEPIDQALLRVGDNDYAYPVRNNIPVLLVEELIEIKGI